MKYQAFGTSKGTDKNTSRSYGSVYSELFAAHKAKLIEQFSFDEEQLEVAWNQWIRVKLNIKLGQLRRKMK
jgi:hypothetical protein